MAFDGAASAHDVVGLDAAILSPAAGVGGLRPPRQLHRPAGRLHATAAPAIASTSSTIRTCARRVGCRGHVHRGPRVQPDVQDPGRPGRPRPGPTVYLRPETAQGMFINFANVLNTSAQEAAVRHRPDRQVVPQRDHARQLRVPHPRVRADGAGVLRAAGRGEQQWYEYWCQERFNWYLDLGIPEDMLMLRAHDADELSHYSLGHERRRVPVPVGLGRAGGHRQPRRLRPHAARRARQREAGVLRPGIRRAVRPARHRACGGCDALDDGVPDGGLRRGGRQRRHPDRAATPPRVIAPYQVAVLPLSKKPETLTEPLARRAARPPCSPTWMCGVRRDPGHRPSLSPSGRDRHAAVRHDRLRQPRGQCGHGARSRLHGAGPRADQRAARHDHREAGALSTPLRRVRHLTRGATRRVRR